MSAEIPLTKKGTWPSEEFRGGKETPLTVKVTIQMKSIWEA